MRLLPNWRKSVAEWDRRKRKNGETQKRLPDMERALMRALSAEFKDGIRGMKNPYEGCRTSQRIVDVIGEALDRGIDLKKKFYDCVQSDTVES